MPKGNRLADYGSLVQRADEAARQQGLETLRFLGTKPLTRAELQETGMLRAEDISNALRAPQYLEPNQHYWHRPWQGGFPMTQPTNRPWNTQMSQPYLDPYAFLGNLGIKY